MRIRTNRVARSMLRAGACTLTAATALALPAVAGAATAPPAGAPAATTAAPATASVVGHVYVNTNTSGANSIASFDRHADGSLTPTAGSPFAAGGAGTGSGLGSQGAIQLADGGRLLIAADAGSNQISVLAVGPHGSLDPVHGSPFSSGGVKPVSVAVHDGLVYVANSGDGGPGNYTGFYLSGGGRLFPIPGSTVTLPAGAAPGDVLFNSTGTRLVGTEVGPSLIDSFAVAFDGRLIRAAGSPYPAQALGPFGSAFRPTDPNQLFVTNAHAGAGAGSVSVFNDGFGATLTPLSSSPFADGQSGTCWVTISPSGNTLYAVNTGTGTISTYTIAPNGALTLQGNTPVSAGRGVGATDAGTSPDGSYLYVDESQAGAVAAFSTASGQPVELSSSPVGLPAGASAAGIAVN